MRKLCLIAVLLLALVAAPCWSAQQAVLPDRFGAWSAASPAQAGKPSGPPQDQLTEAGLASSQIRTYSNAGRTLTVELSQFRDPSSAYGIYTAEINTGMWPSTVGTNTAVDRETLLALVGNLVVRVSPVQNPSTEELRQLIASLRAHSDQTPLPPIRAYLPPGFIDGSQRYARGPAGFRNAITSLKQDEFANLVDEAGFNLSAEAMFAHYRAGKDEAVLLLIEYPTPQLAEQYLHHLGQALSPTAKQAGTTIERKASLLSLVLRPSSAAYGDSLQKSVTYETEITWHEPRQTLTDPPWVTILTRIFLVTGLFMGAAVALGVAFGGMRVVSKIFFPGKVFDRPEQMDVLQLGLSGKRIDSRDFY
jgi:hypothetical protein